ncbi:MAG TPA: cation diffusion facilitator family transporter [Gemmatimonadales bacterium]
MPNGRTGVPDRKKRITRVLAGLLVANLIVVGAKFVIGFSTGSLAVLGDGVHSAVDAMNNVLALAVIAIATKEPDDDHPYGHGKFETLGALGIVAFLSISGFELVKGAVQRLAAGAEPLVVGPVELGLLVATLLVNTVVAAYESSRGHQLHSDLLLADATHTKADVVITIGVLVGVLLSRAGVGMADPIVALMVSGVIVALAMSIVRRSIPVLVDEEGAPAQDIRASAERVDGVHRAYHIRSRRSPEETFAELTIAVDREASVEAAHEIADEVEGRLRDDLQLTQVVVHVEPC